MANKEIIIINDIKNLTNFDYQNLVGQYIDYLKKKPFVRAVYQIGAVNDPGISDFDLVVVVDKCNDPLKMNELSILQAQGNDALKYIVFHDIYLYDCESFEDFHYTNYCNSMELLHGISQPVREINRSEIIPLSVQIIFDFISSRLVQFQNFLATGRLSLRGILVRIYSIKHSYMLLRNLGLENQEVLKFIERVKHLRENLDNIDSQTVLNLFLESFFQFSRIVWMAAKYFSERFLLFHSAIEPSNCLKLNQNFNLKFVDCTPDIYRSVKNETMIYYPEEVFYHYHAYTNCSNLIAEKAKYYISCSGNESYDLIQEYTEVLQKRLDAISNHFEFLKKNRAYYAMKGNPGFTVNYNDINI